MKEIKNAVIGVIVLAITTLGGVLINKYIGGEGEEKEAFQARGSLRRLWVRHRPYRRQRC